ncbi:putative type IX secretion system sortase PorU2 [Dyadobacter luticola]|uniref:Gingipain domain-containing protein n=1 Tax=Dyadobacter luticola TaxID=1979387 RepID=A0A5R9KUZ7_9BACT|nr:C25 family cysteine peptidase [Dyadobacter luticola]TLV00106.1 hypothetical protein FEN17_11380 [Dyadobacter luticola]
MHYTYKLLIRSIWLAAALLFQQTGLAQSGAGYTNQWIAYDQPYIKIGVTAKGLHRVPFSSLPKTFPTDKPEKLQLWHRGKEVAIISTTNNEIVFYGVPNDGSSDSLLYRPMSSRLNPYFSMYSDEGSYFLTVGDVAGSRAKVVDQAVDSKLGLQTIHKELQTKVFNEEYSLSTKSAVKKELINSYFELAASKTGPMMKKDCVLIQNFELRHVADKLAKASVKLLIHGRYSNERKIEVRLGRNTKSLRLVGAISNSGFAATEYTFELKPGDVGEDNKGVFVLKSTSIEKFDRFSLAYYSIQYSQDLELDGKASKEFRLVPGTANWTKVQIKGVSSQTTFLDISDNDNPVVIKGSYQNLMIPRFPGKMSTLLATKEINNIAPEKIREVTFKRLEPKEANYFIITTNNLLSGAEEYAKYRASASGGSFKPMVADVVDIYNQFNYGEPSPVAIRQFMAYMLGDGGKDKYLFLIGKSITYNEKILRELPDQVPSIGYPASDILLVAGLAGANQDVPAIPVGRLSGLTNQHVLDYLQKVKDYEQNTAGDYGWRKKILHLNGGKSTEEVTQLKGLLQALEPMVNDGVIGGTVKPYVKRQGIMETEPVNITADVNEGVGLMTYFGHGATYITDLDFGYITDAPRGYNNIYRYPMMYFNGCGVGDIFSARFNFKPKTPISSDRVPLSLDWLLAPNRGTVAVIANSFESFVGPSSKYLEKLYHNMFVNPATTDLSIGKIQQALVQEIVTNFKDEFSVANVHQSVLQGDPALRLVTVDKPDYDVDPDQSISISSQSPDQTIGNSNSLKINISISNQGRFVGGQSVPVRLTYFGKKGNVVKEQVLKSFPSQTKWQVTLLNSKDIQRIRCELDSKRTIAELNEDNNTAEIEIDWNLVKDKTTFSYENVKDNIPPLLDVTFNDRLLQKDEVIGSNPIINIALNDDRQLFPDTSFIDVFIKKCGDDDCDFEKVAYPASDIVMDAAGSRILTLRLKSELGKGIYEILVNARDRAGNASSEPYRLRFEINEKEEPDIELVVSPNPASSYLRFELKSVKKVDLKSIRYLIYNSQGILVEDKSIESSVLSLKKDWYWYPDRQTAGLYSYKVILYDQENAPIKTQTGKVVILK